MKCGPTATTRPATSGLRSTVRAAPISPNAGMPGRTSVRRTVTADTGQTRSLGGSDTTLGRLDHRSLATRTAATSTTSGSTSLSIRRTTSAFTSMVSVAAGRLASPTPD